TTANTHNHSATSSTTGSPACAPSLPWQCSCADASPGECTDVSSQDGHALLLGAASTSKNRSKELPCLLMCPNRRLPSDLHSYPHRNSSLLQVSIEFLCLSLPVVQFLFTTLTCLFH